MNEEKLSELKLALEKEEKINEELRAARTQFEETHKALFDSQAEVREVISECKEVLTENALAGFAADGEKKRLGGVGIRVSKQLLYDGDLALSWAKEKDLFLQLDRKAFENVAKTGELDFVKIEEVPKVTFPKQIQI